MMVSSVTRSVNYTPINPVTFQNPLEKTTADKIIDYLHQPGNEELLSRFTGIPHVNNVACMQRLHQKYNIQEARKKYPLDDLLSMPRPNSNRPTLEPMRQYWREHGLDKDEYWINSPLFALLFPTAPFPNKEENWDMLYKRYCFALLLEVARRKIVTAEQLAKGLDNAEIKEFLRELAILDGSVGTLWGVHMMLGILTVLRAGTDKHREMFLQDAEAWKILFCMCLTEMGHGSNPLGIETTATLDQVKKCWVINSPINPNENMRTSAKWWPGGLAMHATHAHVLAQMHIGDKWHGPQFFTFRIRDDQGNLLPGITTMHIGKKIELNGIDNGVCWFEQMEVPLDAHLDRFSKVVYEDGAWKYVPIHELADDISKFYLVLLGSFNDSRLFIKIMAEFIPAFCAALCATFPNPNLPEEINHRFLCDFLAETHINILSESVTEGEEKQHEILSRDSKRHDHYLAAVYKAHATDRTEAQLTKLLQLYASEKTAQLALNIIRSLGQNTGPQIYEGSNPLMYTLGSSHLLMEVGCDLQEWKAIAKKLMSNELDFFDRPIAFLKGKILLEAKEVSKHFSSNENAMDTFGTSDAQQHAVNAATFWAAMLRLEEAKKKIIEMPPEEQETHRTLYTIYVNSLFGFQPGLYTKQEVEAAYDKLKGASTFDEYLSVDLAAKLLIPIEWILNMLENVPKKSIPFAQRSKL